MIFLKRLKYPTLLGVLVLMAFVACEDDPTTIGDGLVGSEPFNSSKEEYDVFAFNKNIEAVQTNQLPAYQLGVYNDPLYGRTEARITSQLRLSIANPNFGIFNQRVEDNPDPTSAVQQLGPDKENETVKAVFLYIPYLTQAPLQRDSDNDGVDDVFDDEPTNANNDSDGDTLENVREKVNGTDPLNADTDGDGTPDNEDTETIKNSFVKRFDLDSIYGNRSQQFKLKVERSNYYLRDLDPNTSFQEAQEYFSTQQFSPSFVDEVLFEGDITIDDKEFLFFKEDDPDTDEDETVQVDTRLNPGIRVALDPDFFQTNLLDKESESELVSQTNFTEFLRGIHLSVEPMAGEEMLLLLDLGQASITVTYDYNKVDTKGTSETNDDEIVTEESDFILNLLQVQAQSLTVSGNAVNTFINDAYPAQIADNLDTNVNASRIYLKGGAGSYAEIRLFDDDGDGLSEKINEIKANNWIINEANLVFYVDRTTIDNAGIAPNGDDEPSREPARLYLYKAESGEPLINFATERTTEENLFGAFLNYDGIVQRDDQGMADRYSIKITDHINNLVVRDSLNVNLGLTMTSDVGRIGRLDAMVNGGEEKELPVISTISPVGTVLFGSEPGVENIDKRLKLEIFYTEAN